MEDKTFELLEKLYSEFSEYREQSNRRFDRLQNEVGGLKNDVQGLKSDVQYLKNDVIRIENKIDALYDGYTLTYEKLKEHDKRFDAIEEKLEKQDVEIRVIKSSK